MGQMEVTAISVGRHGIGVRDQLLHGPVILQCLAELGHIQQAEGVGPLHDLIQVIPHAPHLLDQHRYIGGRGLLHLRAVQDTAVKEAPPTDVPVLIREVRRVGNTLNQIMKRANALGLMDVPQLRKALDENRVVEKLIVDAYTTSSD